MEDRQVTIAQKVAVAVKKIVETYTDAKFGFSPPTEYYTGPSLIEEDMKKLGYSIQKQKRTDVALLLQHVPCATD
jgi:hypothetical protein